MPFSAHNCPAAMQVLFRRLGVRQITRSTVIWMVFTTMLLAMTACNTAPTPTPSPTPQVRIIATRYTALLVGELVMTDGCLRVNSILHSDASYLLVWAPEQQVSVEKDTVRIVDHLEGKTVVWHIGEIVRLGGAGGEFKHLDERQRAELPANCPGPYWLVGSVAPSVEASEESAVPSSATPLPTSTPAPTPSPTETPLSQQPTGADITFPSGRGGSCRPG